MRKGFIDLSGQRFGRWSIVSYAGPNKNGNAQWNVRCDCGTEKTVLSTTLRKGESNSCGCLVPEIVSQTSRKHGHTIGNSLSPEYVAWASMIRRCTCPSQVSYKYYGGCGIVVHPAWVLSFQEFLNHVGPMPVKDGVRYTLDRIDPRGNYEPGNVRWADSITQANNKRNSSKLTAFGRTQTVSQWSRETGISVGTLQRRVKLGWSPDRIVSVKPDRRRRRKSQTYTDSDYII